MSESGPSGGSLVRLLQPSDRTWGVLLVAGTFAGALAFSAWAHRAARPPPDRPSEPSTDDLVGWPRAIDPVQALQPARRIARRRHLAGLIASGVKVDGHIDAHGAGRVRYVFQSPPGRGPRAEGMTPNERARACGRQVVRLGSAGLVAAADEPEGACPTPPPQPLPDPACGPRELWALALAKGASGNVPARAEYFRSVSGPAWSFRVGRGEMSFTVDERCQHELSPARARRLSR